ncbi:MAG TPA: hypothetical protein VNT81_10150 [Vicinamibacterales bacterium]|nr:hypothetical protein [Vicinamibacterales bacterium]
MRICVITAALWAAAVPVFAQAPREVSGPWTLTPDMVLCTDLPVIAKPVAKSVIKGLHHPDARLAAAYKGTPLIIGRTPDDGLAPGQKYVTARLHNGGREFPREGEGFGDLRITGAITITATDDLNAMAEVTLACDSIEPGDMLEPHVELSLPTSAGSPDIVPDFTDRAKLLFGSDNRALVGLGSLASVDRGTLHGVVPGARFAIYRDNRNGMPLVHIGEAVVLAVSELSSKVMITKSLDGIESNDVAVPRRAP